MVRRLLYPVLALALGSASVTTAHPHVFVDTSLRLTVEDGQVIRVDVTWSYDDFFTLLIFEDMGLDRDGDGRLTKAELDRLKGFDLQLWPDGFEGDLYMWSNGEKVPLGHPEPTEISVMDGRIVASHSRTVPAAAAAGLEIKQFDPTYYVAYTLAAPVNVSGNCRAEVAPHDPDAATEAVENELATIPEDKFEIMQVGRYFADTIKLTCNGSS